MPDFRLSDRQVDLLLNRLYDAASRVSRSGEAPRVVHFRSGEGRGGDPFTVRCGPCHRALSRTAGVVGSGTVGPNLSGLLSPFYPAGSPPAPPWTPKRLSTWLHNPRSLRPWSPMGPVSVSPRELAQIIAVLSATP
jgi:cytochrome c2